MKKAVSVLLALAMLLCLCGCAASREQGVTVYNDLGVDLTDVKCGISDGSINGIILAESLPAGQSAVLSLQEVCNASGGFVSIVAMDEDANIYSFQSISLQDGAQLRLQGSPEELWAISTADGERSGTRGEYFPGVPYDQAEASRYWGFYHIPEEGFLVIREDGGFELLDLEGAAYNSGTCSFLDGLTLTDRDGETAFFVLDEENNLYGGEDLGTFFRVDAGEAPADQPNYAYSESDFVGYWGYSNGYVLQLLEGRWYLYDNGGSLMQQGPAEFEGPEAWLMNDDGSSGGGYLRFDESGALLDSGELLSRLEGFPMGGGENQANGELAGEWYYSDQEYTLFFDGVEGYVLEGPEVLASGSYSFGGEYVVLYDQDGNVADEGRLDGDGRLWLDSDSSGNWFYLSQ